MIGSDGFWIGGFASFGFDSNESSGGDDGTGFSNCRGRDKQAVSLDPTAKVGRVVTFV